MGLTFRKNNESQSYRVMALYLNRHSHADFVEEPQGNLKLFLPQIKEGKNICLIMV